MGIAICKNPYADVVSGLSTGRMAGTPTHEVEVPVLLVTV